MTMLTTMCVYLLYWHMTEGVTVHFSSPGGNHGVAGIYKAVVNINVLIESPEAEATELGTDYSCASFGSTSHYGLSIRSLSYDAAAGRTVVQLAANTREALSTVISDKTCTPEKSCRKYGPDFRVVMQNLRTKDSGFIKPIASWNDTLYFIYTPDAEDAHYFGYRPHLQLREINNEYTFPTNNYPDAVEVDMFSTSLTYITVEGKWLQAGSSLLPIPRENGKVVFLTVVRSEVYPVVEGAGPQYSYILVAVDEVMAKVLHETVGTTQRWYSHTIGSEGAVSYKDGMLCWTVADRIMCGMWSPDQPFTQPTDIEAVLERGQAAKVCKFYTGLGSGSGNLTTGVALLETPKEDGRLALFFGCFSTIMSKGGLGLLVKDPSKGEADIIPVRYDNKTLLAGAMFVTDDDLCGKIDDAVNPTVAGAERVDIEMKVLLVGLFLMVLVIPF